MNIGDINVVGAMAVIGLLVVALSLYRVHRDPSSAFDLSDFVTTNGKADNAKLCQLGAFLVTSWVMYYMTLKGTLTEWAYAGYMLAWVSARAASLMAAVKSQKQTPAGAPSGSGPHP